LAFASCQEPTACCAFFANATKFKIMPITTEPNLMEAPALSNGIEKRKNPALTSKIKGPPYVKRELRIGQRWYFIN